MEILEMFFYYILAIGGMFLSGISFYKITDCFVIPRENKIFKVLAFLGLTLSLTTTIPISDIENVLYPLTGYLAVMVFCYKGSTIKKISMVMIFFPIIVSINFLGNDLPLSGMIEKYVLWIYGLALFWWIIYKIIKDKILYAKQYINDKTWLLIDIICFAPFISILVTIIWTGYEEKYKAYTIAFVCIISNIGVLILINYIIQSVKIRMDNQNYKLQYDYYKSLEEKQLKTRKIYHDMNNNLQVVRTYLDNDDLKKAKGYVENLASGVKKYRNKTFCKNGIVNAVLNTKYDLIKENEIDCSINISLDNMIAIDDMDLCSIFSNTLDNAIEASLKIVDPKERKIILKARTDKGYFSYSLTNNKVNDVLTHKEYIMSSKADKNLHGFGIQNVKDIIDKYNGTLDISYTDKEFSLIMIIKIS